ncbi:MAG: hypothetical protein K5637_00780 [Lachnospiraceae bacterium]|nr:hypothetical protein [Lachnospiraceae bacterium]
MTKINTIGIDDNLDRGRIKKLLVLGIIGSVLTGAGDFLVGFGEQTDPAPETLAENLMANVLNLSDTQLIAGGLFGVFGILLEALAFFAIYRLMADSSLKYAHIYRAGIIGYIWLAPIGCHMNIGILNIAYKHLLQLDEAVAAELANKLILAFYVPLWIMLVILWLPALIVQFKAFSEGLTPYPRYARWFNVFVGMIPALIISAIAGPETALGGGIGTMFLSFGNLFTFGGLLAALPSEKKFEEFRRKAEQKKVQSV